MKCSCIPNAIVNNECHDPQRWRLCLAEQIASEMNMEDWGIKSVYLFGSTALNNAEAGSDIDLIIHSDDDVHRKELLLHWLDGWNKALCGLNFIMTGIKLPYMLDVHLITDQDIRENTCFASKINTPYEPAILLCHKETC